ncbi:hypothetical protein [Paraburkholderia sp. BR10882]|uniref:hypothetical protein n=1 Tax=unclassified Paraburkholderia TaxID=2615204 RepID=UPI0034CE3ABD
MSITWQQPHHPRFFEVDIEDEQLALLVRNEVDLWVSDNELLAVDIHTFRNCEQISTFDPQLGKFVGSEEFGVYFSIVVDFEADADAIAFKLRFC